MMQVARFLGMNGSTCFNILKTLERERLLSYDEATKTYQLGLHLVDLASMVDENGRMAEIAMHHARELVSELELACLLVTRTSDDDFLVIDKVESSRPIKVTVAVGERFPINSAVLAKGYFAWQSEDVVDEFLDRHGLPAYSPKSITDPAVFKASLETARQKGFAESEAEYLQDHHAIAAPIFGRDGNVRFLFVTVGFAFELPADVMQDYGTRLRRAADLVSEEIGGRTTAG